MQIPSTELMFTFSRASGAGGQNVNKVNSKATLAWDIRNTTCIADSVKFRFMQKFSNYINEEGLVKITSQRFRDQPQNIADCIEKLHALLKQVMNPPVKRVKTKPTKTSIEKRIKIKKISSQIKKNRQRIKDI
jgi:ribosome-associated protein